MKSNILKKKQKNFALKRKNNPRYRYLKQRKDIIY